MKRRILVIEDKPEIREVLRVILELQNISVVEAQHGREGLEVILRRESDFDLILLDWNMPVMGGESFLCEWTARRSKKIPVIVISAIEPPPSVQYQSLLKPFNVND